MVGKGSVNHNSRKFKAENVDGSRTHLNIDYCNENIKKVYDGSICLSISLCISRKLSSKSLIFSS